MKLQRLDWCKGTQKLIPFIASGQLRSEFTEPFIHGTYLEAWWRCLKFSKEFIQSSRTGIFTSKASYDTFCMFGPLEDISFKDWWMKKGHELFSSSITTLQVTLFVRRKNAKIYSVSVNAFQDVSTRLAAQEFGFWLDQIFLLNAKEGLLSEAPLAWPIFKSRISYEVISQLLGIMEIHDQIIRNAPNTKLWQIGEQLGLNPQAMPKVSDYPKETEEKHRRMGQTVSSYLIKGKGLVDNAYKGAFPKYSN